MTESTVEKRKPTPEEVLQQHYDALDGGADGTLPATIAGLIRSAQQMLAGLKGFQDAVAEADGEIVKAVWQAKQCMEGAGYEVFFKSDQHTKLRQLGHDLTRVKHEWDKAALVILELMHSEKNYDDVA